MVLFLGLVCREHLVLLNTCLISFLFTGDSVSLSRRDLDKWLQLKEVIAVKYNDILDKKLFQRVKGLRMGLWVIFQQDTDPLQEHQNIRVPYKKQVPLFPHRICITNFHLKMQIQFNGFIYLEIAAGKGRLY